MFDIDWNPVILNIGTLEIRWYGVLVVLAVIAVIALSLVEARRRGIAQDVIWDVALWAVVGGIIGARLLHIIDRWQYYLYHPEQLLNFAGLAIWGAMLGGLAAILIFCLVKKMSFWLLGDIAAPGAILGQAIGRLGCLVNGCCYGLTCELPIAVIYSNPNSYAPIGVPIYPTQLFHIVWDLAGFAVLWSLRKKLRPEGTLFLLWLIFFGMGDFVIRFFRESEPFLFNLPQAQVIDILIVVAAVITLIVRYAMYRKAKQPMAGTEVSKSV
ncbi:MAG: prolipoprotein diacylglyceryl transferase [Dehalococcoidia bacterium]|nr:prolipoprotein diacylglyceryl transferase [Dehalococcoidia bacterium]